MVDHNHDRIKAIDWGEVSDEIHGEVLERMRAFEGEGGDGWYHRMGENLVCLANCISRDMLLDIGGKAGPPVIFGKEGDGVKVTAMATFEGTVGGKD